MKDLLTYIVSNLIDSKDKLEISESENEGTIVYSITADKEDVGRIIGKGGKIIKAIRAIIRMAAIKEDQRTFVEVKAFE